MGPVCDAAGPAPTALPAVACRRRLEHGEVLCRADDPQESLFAVRAGFAKATVPVPGGGEHIVRFHMPGDVIGLEGFGPRRHAASVTALEGCEVCEIPLRRAQILSDAFPSVAAHVRQVLARQLARTESDLVVLTHCSAPQRLARFLLDISEAWAARGYASREFRLPMERREIADHLGLTLETVSRLLSAFRERGWASVVQRDVRLLDPEALRNCPRALPPPPANP